VTPDRQGEAPRPLLIVNPLPHALAHYQEALVDEVGPPVSGADVVRPDFEVGGSGRLGKAVGALRASARLARAATRRQETLVLWPTFGLADLALWRVACQGVPRIVIIHDPVPLRRQYGFGRIGKALGRWGSRGKDVRVVVHTQLARESLEAIGIEVGAVLPHPTLAPRSRTRHAGPPIVRVLGQFKGARDVALLEGIAEQAPAEWRLEIAGRGWPEIRGWHTDDRFLSEEELTAAFDSSAVVLVPYLHYFQSGIATRAYERGVPVVAHRHEFIESLYGSRWIGLVDGPGCRAWVRAITTAMGAETTSTQSNRTTNAQAWRAALGGT
jgi:hypothetical protein